FVGNAAREVWRLKPLSGIANLVYAPFRPVRLTADDGLRDVTEFDSAFDDFVTKLLGSDRARSYAAPLI
ncbi:MAG: hypothetical protein ABR555_13620, partial [Pyrinomonadaceae bacterium]